MFLKKEMPAADDSEAPTAGGTWNDQPFSDLSDADSRIGDHIEVFIAGTYTWIPTRYIERLEIEAPKDLRDLLWARARIECSPKFRLQELGEVLLPVLSPLSYLSSDEAVKLGRLSVWEDEADGGERLMGQKLLLVDGEEIPLLEFRSIIWTKSEEPAGESADAAS
jgi:type VI secretion system protein ImpE